MESEVSQVELETEKGEKTDTERDWEAEEVGERETERKK